MKLAPKQLILQLLSAAPENAVSVRGLARASELMGISENALRVALTRLKNDGMVRSARRGFYELGPRAIPLQRQIADWRMREALVNDVWDGVWVGVHAPFWPKGDRSWLRAKQRVLQIWGFRQAVEGLWMRPNNLDLSIHELRSRLSGLGLPDDTPVFLMHELGHFEDTVREIWDREALESMYREGLAHLDNERNRLRAEPVEPAAAEAFDIGSEAIRNVLFDPLLPEPLVDVKARREYLEKVKSFVKFGRSLWLEVLSKTEAWTPEKMDQGQ